jgi:hypothetical protein
MKIIRVSLIAMILAAGAAAQIPEILQPPSSEVILLKALGKGKQVYACKAKSGAEGQFEWVLDRPEATLFGEDGARTGKHYKGPTWEATDGSKVIGQVSQRAAAPAANAVPWLLLKASSHEGTGTFARVSYIQRVDTQGGVAPAEGCDKSHVAAEVSVDYQASYIFYAPK